MRKTSEARQEPGVVDEVRKLVGKLRGLQVELEALPARGSALRAEVEALEESTADGDVQGLEILNARRVRLSCIPGTRRRLEKEIGALELELAPRLEPLRSAVLSEARQDYDKVVAEATAALKPFYLSEEAARQVAIATPAVKNATARIYRVENCDVFDREDALTAAEKLLAVADEKGSAQ